MTRNFSRLKPQRRGAPRQRENGHQVEQHERGERHEACRRRASSNDRGGPSASAPRRARCCFERLAEHRRLGNRQPHVQPDDDQRGAGEKRDAPAEGEELIVGEPASRARETRRPRTGSRSARRAAGTCRTRRACPAARSRSRAGRRRPTRRRDRGPGRSGRARAAAARRCRWWHRSAARRSSPSTRPWSAAPRPASSCGRRDRRSGRRARSRSAARGTRWQTSPATRAWPRPDPIAGKNRRGKTSTAAVA